ncbi:hypothetical protein V2J09_009549, partial [Rumex salicifolius]
EYWSERKSDRQKGVRQRQIRISGLVQRKKGKRGESSSSIQVVTQVDGCQQYCPLDEEGDKAPGKFSNFGPEFIQAMCYEMMKVFKGKGVMPSSSNYTISKTAAQKGLMACFDKSCCALQDLQSKSIVAMGREVGGLYKLRAHEEGVSSFNKVCFTTSIEGNNRVIHDRLCHISYSRMRHVINCDFEPASERQHGLFLSIISSREVDKFDTKGRRSDLLGYPSNQKGYRLYNLVSHEIYHIRDVFFHKEKFPFKQPEPTPAPSLKQSLFLDVAHTTEEDLLKTHVEALTRPSRNKQLPVWTKDYVLAAHNVAKSIDENIEYSASLARVMAIAEPARYCEAAYS